MYIYIYVCVCIYYISVLINSFMCVTQDKYIGYKNKIKYCKHFKCIIIDGNYITVILHYYEYGFPSLTSLYNKYIH